MSQASRLTGFEVFVGKGRHARRIGAARNGLLFNLFMAWMRRGS